MCSLNRMETIHKDIFENQINVNSVAYARAKKKKAAELTNIAIPVASYYIIFLPSLFHFDFIEREFR